MTSLLWDELPIIYLHDQTGQIIDALKLRTSGPLIIYGHMLENKQVITLARDIDPIDDDATTEARTIAEAKRIWQAKVDEGYSVA